MKMKKIISKIKGVIIIELAFHILCELGISTYPIITKWLFDHVFRIVMRTVVIAAVLFLLIRIFITLTQYVSQNYAWKVEAQFNKRANKELFSRIIGQPFQQFLSKSSAEYLSVLQNQVQTVETDFVEAGIEILKSFFSLIIYTITMILIVDFRLTIILLILSLFSIFIPKIVAKELAVARSEQMKSLEKYFGKVDNLLSGIYFVNPFSIRNFKIQQQKAAEKVAKATEKYGKKASFKNNLNAFILYMIEVIILIYSIILLKNHAITLGAAVAAMTYVDNFIYPIQYILNAINQIHGSKIIKNELENYLELPEPLEKNLEIRDCKTIIVKRVKNDFMTSTQNFKIFPYQKVLLRGASGTGKTTFLNILAGIEREFQGELIQKNSIFYSNQFAMIFDANFEENVTVFGTYPLTRKVNEILEILKKDPFDFREGKKLSGGEKQMIAFIRAVNAPHNVILLDEPFSSIDQNRSELLMEYLITIDKIVIIAEHSKVVEEKFDRVLRL